MSLKSKIPFFIAMTSLLGKSGIGSQSYNKKKGNSIIPYGTDSYRDKKVPKGCQVFYFASDGSFQMSKSSQHTIEIVALNQKNAVRKFNNRIEEHKNDQ
jgi:hypothetical protein